MNRIFKYLAGSTTAIAIIAVSPAANAISKQAEINQARVACHVQKKNVLSHGSFATDKDRSAWETACGHATELMDAQSGKTPDALVAKQEPVITDNSAEIAALETKPAQAE